MRKDGKTTRLIDEAIQHLFEKGEIKFLSNQDIFEKHQDWRRGLSVGQVNDRLKFIDYDATKTNKAQENFIHRFARRLSIEHDGCYRVHNKHHFTVIK